MELANIMLKVGGDGFTIVPMYNVTPAEALLLNEIHDPADRQAVTELDIVDVEDRSKQEEFARLQGKYQAQPVTKFRELFGASAAAIPMTFEEVGLHEPEVVIKPKKERRTSVDLSAKKYVRPDPKHKQPEVEPVPSFETD